MADTDHILEGLNPEQAEAARTVRGPVVGGQYALELLDRIAHKLGT